MTRTLPPIHLMTYLQFGRYLKRHRLTGAAADAVAMQRARQQKAMTLEERVDFAQRLRREAGCAQLPGCKCRVCVEVLRQEVSEERIDWVQTMFTLNWIANS